MGLTPQMISDAFSQGQAQQKLTQSGVAIPSEIGLRNAQASHLNTQTGLLDPEFKLKQQELANKTRLGELGIGVDQSRVAVAQRQVALEEQAAQYKIEALKANALGETARANALIQQSLLAKQAADTLREVGGTIDINGRAVPFEAFDAKDLLTAETHKLSSGGGGKAALVQMLMKDNPGMSVEEAQQKVNELGSYSEQRAKQKIAEILLGDTAMQRLLRKDPVTFGNIVNQAYQASVPKGTTIKNPIPSPGGGGSGSRDVIRYDSSGNRIK